MSPGAEIFAALLRFIVRPPDSPSNSAESTPSSAATRLSWEADIALDGEAVSETASASMSSSGLDRAKTVASCCALSVNVTEVPSDWPASSRPAREVPPDEAPLSRM